ncbi:MAG: flagellar type III secretion system protein FlhB, partial [Rubrivivax sp.]
ALVFNIATGLVGRVMPQFQVFFVASPLQVLLGLAVFALSLAAAWGVLAIGGTYLCQNLATALLPFIEHPDSINVHGAGGQAVLRQAVGAAAPTLVAVCIAASIAGVAGNLMQHGFLWTTEKLKPDASKLNLMKGMQRIFGVDGLVQFGKSILKVVVVGFVCWWVLRPRMDELANLSALDVAAILPLSIEILRALFMAVLALLAVTGGADWFWQRYRFMERMKMSKEEMKEETKSTEGDPHIKAKLRQKRMEASRRRMMQAVPKATVVIMNPTHYAVALHYEQGEHAAPKCVAKGLDALALKIRAVAEDAGVEVIEDPPLARALYATVEVDAFI